MNITEVCILCACLLPLACAWLAKFKAFGKPRREGGFDNHHPRQWLANLEGWQARAHAAQQNSFEALPVFIAGALIAQRTVETSALIDALALLFIGARVAYIACYLADRAALRSLTWFIALGSSVALFFIR